MAIYVTLVNFTRGWRRSFAWRYRTGTGAASEKSGARPRNLALSACAFRRWCGHGRSRAPA